MALLLSWLVAAVTAVAVAFKLFWNSPGPLAAAAARPAPSGAAAHPTSDDPVAGPLIERLKCALLAHALHRSAARDFVTRTDYDNASVFDGSRLPPLSGPSHLHALLAYLDPRGMRTSKQETIRRYLDARLRSEADLALLLAMAVDP